MVVFEKEGIVRLGCNLHANMSAWVVVVSRVKLGVAFSMSGAFFYILLALLSWWFYDEGRSRKIN